MHRAGVVIGLLVLGAGAACAPGHRHQTPVAPEEHAKPVPASARIEGTTRGDSTQHIMSAVVQKSYGALVEGLTPATIDADAWAALEAHVRKLNESGLVLLRHDSAKEKESWVAAAAQLERGTAKALDAILASDLTKARAAAEQMANACASCHEECEAAYRLPWNR